MNRGIMGRIEQQPKSYLISQEHDRIVITYYAGRGYSGAVLSMQVMSLADARGFHDDLGKVLGRA